MRFIFAFCFLVPAVLAFRRPLDTMDNSESESGSMESSMFVDIDSKIRSAGNKLFVTLMCSGDFDSDEVHFKWMKEGKEIQNADPLDPTYRFELTPVSKRTLGHYQCAVQRDDASDETRWSYSPDMEIKMPTEPRRHKRRAQSPRCSTDTDCKKFCTKMAKNMVSEADKDNVRATWDCGSDRKCACGAVL